MQPTKSYGTPPMCAEKSKPRSQGKSWKEIQILKHVDQVGQCRASMRGGVLSQRWFDLNWMSLKVWRLKSPLAASIHISLFVLHTNSNTNTNTNTKRNTHTNIYQHFLLRIWNDFKGSTVDSILFRERSWGVLAHTSYLSIASIAVLV